jgi:hypothetical protein
LLKPACMCWKSWGSQPSARMGGPLTFLALRWQCHIWRAAVGGNWSCRPWTVRHRRALSAMYLCILNSSWLRSVENTGWDDLLHDVHEESFRALASVYRTAPPTLHVIGPKY